jgi:hypothetical protein
MLFFILVKSLPSNLQAVCMLTLETEERHLQQSRITDQEKYVLYILEKLRHSML